MDSKERSGHCAAQAHARSAVKQEKEEDHIQGMQQNVGKVVTGRAQPEHLDVSHVREPSDGVPVGFGGGGESPGYAGARETLLHLIVIRDVRGVVIADEAVSQRVCIKRERHQRKGYCKQCRRVALQPRLAISSRLSGKIELSRARRRAHLFTNS